MACFDDSTLSLAASRVWRGFWAQKCRIRLQMTDGNSYSTVSSACLTRKELIKGRTIIPLIFLSIIAGKNPGVALPSLISIGRSSSNCMARKVPLWTLSCCTWRPIPSSIDHQRGPRKTVIAAFTTTRLEMAKGTGEPQQVEKKTRTTEKTTGKIKRQTEEGTPLSSSSSNSILHSWATHTNDSFHDFTPEEAKAIRQSLLNWYATNRRKLPWRGDLPPYDGSTAGINRSSNDRKKSSTTQKKIAALKDQPKINSFFHRKRSNKITETTRQNGGDDQFDEDATVAVLAEGTTTTTYCNSDNSRVSGYGIWVSEIMLQQTRVEAVIPYYLKCECAARAQHEH